MPEGAAKPGRPIPDCYDLKETPSADYLQRTEWNVRDSDGTVVFTLATKVTGGSLRTIEFARKHRKPCIHIALGSGDAGSAGDLFVQTPPARLRQFVKEHRIRVLNVAGSRESKEPGLHDAVVRVLEDALIIAGAT